MQPSHRAAFGLRPHASAPNVRSVRTQVSEDGQGAGCGVGGEGAGKSRAPLIPRELELFLGNSESGPRALRRLCIFVCHAMARWQSSATISGRPRVQPRSCHLTPCPPTTAAAATPPPNAELTARQHRSWAYLIAFVVRMRYASPWSQTLHQGWWSCSLVAGNFTPEGARCF